MIDEQKQRIRELNESIFLHALRSVELNAQIASNSYKGNTTNMTTRRALEQALDSLNAAMKVLREIEDEAAGL